MITDVDDNTFIDFVGSWGPMILGHAHPEVVAAIQKAATDGTSFGAPSPLEVELAAMVCDAVPSLEKVRFVNSGTEATMSAVRLARGYTGRKVVVKFDGCYHGHADSFLVKAGSGVITLGIPGSPGVPDDIVKNTLSIPYNNVSVLEQTLRDESLDIACVIVEPVAGNMGVVVPTPSFLAKLRELTRELGIVLIFDEVITGFRLALGGAQERFGITPDLTCLGKIIGGGLPVGAYGGKREIMDMVAPDGPVYQAGTLSGNPLAMSAGLAMLTELNNKPEIFRSLADKTAYLHKGFDRVLKGKEIPYQINRFGSMISLHFTEKPVVDFASSAKGDNETFKKYFHGMLSQGIYLPPSAFESYFLNDALTYEDLDATITALETIIPQLQ